MMDIENAKESILKNLVEKDCKECGSVKNTKHEMLQCWQTANFRTSLWRNQVA